MINNELVSIITPMYNARSYIGKTIESVLNQTYLNWEMIIVDDCSTDESAEIVNKYVLMDSRIKYFRQSENGGVAKARNTAMQKASGRYLAFLDSDDLWKPEKLQRQMCLLKEQECAFVYSGCDVIDEQGNALNKIRHVPKAITYEQLLWGNVIPCLTVVLDREKTGDFQMPSIGHEDYATWLMIFQRIHRAFGIDEPMASYRVNRNSVSGNKLRTIKWTWNIYRNEQNISFIKSIMYLFGHLMQAARKMR